VRKLDLALPAVYLATQQAKGADAKKEKKF
jgi:hypothetical protein